MKTLFDSAQRVAEAVLEPLCEATRKLFKPARLLASDRLRVALNADGRNFVVKAYATNSVTGRETFASHVAATGWVARVPERKSLGIGEWELAGTDFTALVMNAVWPADRLEFEPDAKLMYEYLLARFLKQTLNAKERAIFQADPKKWAASWENKYIDHPKLPLANFQHVGLNTCMNEEAAALFMEQGTGKTPIVISRICNEAAAGVAPAAVASKTRDLVADAERQATEKVKELEDEAKEKALRFAAKLKERVERQAAHVNAVLKVRLYHALKHATGEVLGTSDAKRVEGVSDQAADAMLKGLAEQNKEQALERARLRALAYAEKVAASARDVGEAFTTEVTRLADGRVAELRAASKNDRMYRVFIVCPKNVRVNWREEFIRFATVPGKVAVLRGGQLTRAKLLVEAFQAEDGCKWTAVVASYETVRRSWNAIKMIEWDLVVLDESHYIKRASTQRFKTMIKLRELANQRMVLTGTPITNTMLDLWAQLEFLGDGLSGFRSWQNFKTYYGKWERRQHGNVLVGYKNVPLMQERLTRLAYLIRKEQALPELPEKLFDVHEVEMSKEQRDYYLKIRTQLLVEIETEMAEAEADGRVLTVNNVLTRMLRLAQVTSGFITWDAQYSDDGDEISARVVDRIDPNPKVEALVELLKAEGPKEKAIVWACWVQDIKTIRARLEQEGIDCVTFYGATKDADREEAVRRFNEDPACRVFVGNPAAGGVGLNLVGYDYWNDPPSQDTRASHEIYFSQNWSPTARSQSEDRAHRRGTRGNVRITDLVVPGTIDEEIRTRVLGKHMRAYEIQDVRAIMNRLLETDPEIGD